MHTYSKIHVFSARNGLWWCYHSADQSKAHSVLPPSGLNIVSAVPVGNRKRSGYPNNSTKGTQAASLGLADASASYINSPLEAAIHAQTQFDQHRVTVTRVAQEQIEEREEGLQKARHELKPVFRFSPFTAEAGRRTKRRTCARILFVDEGNCCRSVVAEAMFRKLLTKMAANGMGLDVRVESASLGPAFVEHDRRVLRLAREAGLQLPPRSMRCFDEVKDMVEFDLVLVMDKFDFDEVMREVAVLDTINPGGFYSARVRQFGNFAAASTHFKPHKTQWALGEGISDPLYGNVGGEEEQAALWGALRKLRLACAGLAQYLTQLQSRSVAGMSLQQAVSQAVLCPLLGPEVPQSMQNSAWAVPVKEKDWRPVWRVEGSDANGHVYTIREKNGRGFIVRRPDPLYRVKRGYWKDLANVEEELRKWSVNHGVGEERLPTNRALRSSGASQLCNAIEFHGGFNAVAQKLGLKAANRHGNGYWSKEEHLKQELVDYARTEHNASSQQVRRMPSLADLEQKGRGDLAYAVLKWGGIRAAAKVAGLPLGTARQRHSQYSLVHANEVLAKCFPDHVRRGCMPSRTELIDQGHTKLAREIQELGGFKAVATELGLHYMRAGRNTSKQWQAAHELASVHSAT